MVGIKWGALLGGALDASSGDDSPLDGAIKGAVIGGIVKIAAPIVLTYAVGWLVLKGISEGAERIGDVVGGNPSTPARDE